MITTVTACAVLEDGYNRWLTPQQRDTLLVPNITEQLGGYFYEGLLTEFKKTWRKFLGAGQFSPSNVLLFLHFCWRGKWHHEFTVVNVRVTTLCCNQLKYSLECSARRSSLCCLPRICFPLLSHIVSLTGIFCLSVKAISPWMSSRNDRNIAER